MQLYHGGLPLPWAVSTLLWHRAGHWAASTQRSHFSLYLCTCISISTSTNCTGTALCHAARVPPRCQLNIHGIVIRSAPKCGIICDCCLWCSPAGGAACWACVAAAAAAPPPSFHLPLAHQPHTQRAHLCAAHRAHAAHCVPAAFARVGPRSRC